jgi:hypothetical protein
MKKFYALALCIITVNATKSQNWVNGGNTLSANGTIGTNSSHSLLFETAGVERGRITNGGNWAIGSTGTTSRFTVNAPAAVSPFRAQVNGGTKLLVNGNGGLSVGTPNAAPANGLFVAGRVGIGISPSIQTLEILGGQRLHGTPLGATNLEFFRPGLSTDYRLSHSAHYLYVSQSTTDFQGSLDVASFGPPQDFKFIVFGNALAAGGTWISSDVKLKKDVNDLTNAMSVILQLKPKTYYFKSDEYSNLGLPVQKQYGFLAQDLEKQVPEMVMSSDLPVSKTESGDRILESIKSVNYTTLIPVIVKGMQEMDSALKAKDEEIAFLKEKLNEVLISIGREGLPSNAGWIKQNTPNPVSVSTAIHYFIPQHARSAHILVTNAKGQQLKIYNVAGMGVVNFSAGTLPSGIYNYSLVVNGKTISTKKLVIAR